MFNKEILIMLQNSKTSECEEENESLFKLEKCLWMKKGEREIAWSYFMHHFCQHRKVYVRCQWKYSTLNVCVCACACIVWEREREGKGVNYYQHFTSSFYAHISQKRKKDSQNKQLFALSEAACVKAACKHVGEIDPWFCKRESCNDVAENGLLLLELLRRCVPNPCIDYLCV